MSMQSTYKSTKTVKMLLMLDIQHVSFGGDICWTTAWYSFHNIRIRFMNSLFSLLKRFSAHEKIWSLLFGWSYLVVKLYSHVMFFFELKNRRFHESYLNLLWSFYEVNYISNQEIKRVIFFKDKLKSRYISFSGYIDTTWSIYNDDIVYKVAP